MHTSFILFIILVVVIVAISAFRLGIIINKAAKQASPEAKNTTPYKDCLEQNKAAYKYGTFTDKRDGQTYRTVQIGDQVWMAENLRYKAEGSFAPDNDDANLDVYGRLYTWTTALDIPPAFSEQALAKDIAMYEEIRGKNYRGIAPEGWHIPSNKEWEQLLANLDPNLNGIELRSACFWQVPGEDTLGFFAVPAGYRFGNGNFCHFGNRARFWSKDEYGKTNAFRFSLTNKSADIEGVYRSDALSIRCVKNT